MNAPVTMAVMPGFPRPLVDGPHFSALVEHVAAHGQPRPILMDRAGTVWGERTLWNVCLALCIAPRYQVVDSGEDAAIQELATRDLTVLERADLVRVVYDDASTKFVLADFSKRSMAVSDWFKRVLGKDFGFSPSQVEQYLRVARSSPSHRRELMKAATLHQAVRILKALDRQTPLPGGTPTSPAMEEQAVVTTINHLLDLITRVKSWSHSGEDALVRLMAAIKCLLDHATVNEAELIMDPVVQIQSRVKDHQ